MSHSQGAHSYILERVATWFQAMESDGLTLAHLEQAIDSQELRKQLLACWKKGREAPLVYDAAAVSRILGLPCECNDPVPEAREGEVVLYYGGWSLKDLRNCTAGTKRMWQDQDWYEKYGWTAEPGYYRLLLPVPGSNRKTWDEQAAHLQFIDPSWQPAPVTVTAAALLVHLMETNNDLLSDDWCRCAEPFPDDNRTGLTVSAGRVGVNGSWDDDRHGSIWLAAARKS